MSDDRRLRVDYSAAELDSALEALEAILDDLEWPAGPVSIPRDDLLGELRSRGVTRGLANALFERLTEYEVFRYRKTTTPAGVSRENGLPVLRLEPEVDELYVTTKDLWRDYLARREQERQQAELPPAGPPSGAAAAEEASLNGADSAAPAEVPAGGPSADDGAPCGGRILPTLSGDDVTILEFLALHRHCTWTQEELAGPGRVNLSVRTIGRRLKYLRKLGLTGRPHGPKKGEAITPLGLEIIGQR
jgi:hypothetical protein